MNGQAIKQDFYILKTSTTTTTVELQPIYNTGCNFYLPALAEYTPTSELKNDRHSVIWFFNDLYSDVKIFIQEMNSAGVYEDVQELTDDTYGTMYGFGFFVNKFGESAIGYQIEWSDVLNEQGPGIYRFRVEAINAIGDDFADVSFEFKLSVYTADRADTTVRVDWHRNGVLGSRTQDEKVEDYGIEDWFNQIRIPKAMFGFGTAALEQEWVHYQNGENEWLSDKQVEELTLKIDSLPSNIHDFIRVDMLMSGKLRVTDYNLLAPTKTVNRYVVRTGSYEPQWIPGVELGKANVTTTFKPWKENLYRKRE